MEPEEELKQLIAELREELSKIDGQQRLTFWDRIAPDFPLIAFFGMVCIVGVAIAIASAFQ